MKILWIIERKDGSTIKVITEEAAEPISGDGAVVDGIPVAVGTRVTTPRAGDLERHDVVVSAREQ